MKTWTFAESPLLGGRASLSSKPSSKGDFAFQPNKPHPSLACALCLWSAGIGYDRIARKLRLEKHRVFKFIKLRMVKRGLNRSLIYVPKPRLKKKIQKPDPSLRILGRIATRSEIRRRKYLRAKLWCWLFVYQRSKMVESIVGCPKADFIEFIQSQFQHGMTWQNYGSAWEFDHITPCKSFDLSRLDHIKRCFHYSNLRPYSKTLNRRKSAKITPHQPELLLSSSGIIANRPAS